MGDDRGGARRRPGRWAGRAAAVLVLSCLAVGVAMVGRSTAAGTSESRAAAPAARQSGTAVRTTAGTGLVRWGETFSSASGYERFRYLFVTRADARRAASLPGISLVYASGTSIKKTWSTGVTLQEVTAGGWLLDGVDGRPLMNVQYDAYIADIGNQAYQDRFISNWITFLKRTRTDGIFIDDVIGLPTLLSGDENAWPARYPNQQAWEDAMVSFVRRVGTVMRKQGYYVAVSAHKFIPGDLSSNDGTMEAAFWRRIAPYVSGMMSEYWIQDPTNVDRLRSNGTDWWDHWQGWQGLVRIAQAGGADFFGHVYGSSGAQRTMRYGRASFLLDWNGKGGAFVYTMTDRPDPRHDLLLADFGRPVRPKIQRLPGVFQRRYERGLVVVNTTRDPVQLLVNKVRVTIDGTDAVLSPFPR